MSAMVRWRWVAIAGLSAVGTAVSAYLTAAHWRPGALACGPAGGCHAVQSSPYATVHGVPVALLGLGMSVALAALIRVGPVAEPYLLLGVFGLALVGAGYWAWLTWVELAVIRAVCPWCVISAVLVTAVFALATGEVVRRLARPPRPAQDPGGGRH